MKNIHKDVVCSNDSIKNILGIIGAQTSEVSRYIAQAEAGVTSSNHRQVSLEIARLGRIFRVPQVRYWLLTTDY